MKERSIKSRKQNLKCVNSECATFESNAKRCLLCVTCFFLHLRIYGYVIAVPSEPRWLGGPIFQQIGTLTLFELGVGTVCSNEFFVDISNHHQMQQYKSCLKAFL